MDAPAVARSPSMGALPRWNKRRTALALPSDNVSMALVSHLETRLPYGEFRAPYCIRSPWKAGAARAVPEIS